MRFFHNNKYIYNTSYYNLSVCMYLSNNRHNKLFLIELIVFKTNNKVDL